MVEIRLRTVIPRVELESKVAKIVGEQDFNLLLTRAARVRMPDGRLLCTYLPGVLKSESERLYPELAAIKVTTDNRGHASGTLRTRRGRRTHSKRVRSAVLGSFDPTPPKPYCRVSSFSRDEGERWNTMRPLFAAMGTQFKEHVGDRFAVQMGHVAETEPDWVVPGTPFTTITVNNSYPTGVHMDKGDLDEGFSCLAVLRRGTYTGGCLTFPEYRIAVDLRDGDLLLMDAHQWHGNTAMVCACGELLDGPCAECGAERISIVAYYRTKLSTCGTVAEEDEKRMRIREGNNERLLAR